MPERCFLYGAGARLGDLNFSMRLIAYFGLEMIF